MSRLFAALLAGFFLFTSLPAVAATTSLVRGTVTMAGMPCPSAAVTLTGEGSRLATKTDARGRYVFSQVPFGHYHLTVTAMGAMTHTMDLDVNSDSVATADVPLDRMREIAHMAVTARAGVGGNPVSVNTISKAQISSSPNRDSLNRLIETVPGIVRFSYNEPVAHGFHGLTYEIDGAPLPQATTSNFAEIVDPKSIDSLEVLTGAFPAEYGGSRQGAVVNIVTARLSNVAPGTYGHISVGGGNVASAVTSFEQTQRFAHAQLTFSLNMQRNDRGIDAPTYTATHDNSSQSDEFLRYLTQLGSRSTLAFDLSHQFSQFQIPINTNSNNATDPIVSMPGTDDVQREYDRYLNLSFTTASKDGGTIFQAIPWLRFTRVAYDGDLANDVLAVAPNSDTTDPFAPAFAPQVGLRQDRHASYEGIRLSQFRATDRHAWKIGLDASREQFDATQTFGCYEVDCNPAPATPPPAPPAPGYYAFDSTQHQTGSQIGLYAQDKWQPTRLVAINAGIRYDHSTGYTGGWQISPRIGINLSDGGRNVVHVYYGRLYAAPSLEDVRAACVLLNGCSGTPVYDLQPERDAYYELGVAHQFNEHLSGYMNIFSRTAVNVLDTTQFLNTPLFAVFNNATGRDTGVELRLQNETHGGDSWFLTSTVSGAYAGGVSGSTFLFPPGTNPPGVPITSSELLAPEDHDQTVATTAGYTHRFTDKRWYATLQGEYGTGYPVNFQNANTNLSGRLPSHVTFDLALGREPGTRAADGLGFSLDIQNLLNHQYLLKIANGFNTTQVAQGMQVLFRVTAPF